MTKTDEVLPLKAHVCLKKFTIDSKWGNCTKNTPTDLHCKIFQSEKYLAQKYFTFARTH